MLTPVFTTAATGWSGLTVGRLPLLGWSVCTPFVRGGGDRTPPHLCQFDRITLRWFGDRNVVVRWPWLYRLLWRKWLASLSPG